MEATLIMSAKTQFEPNYAFPPGETLLETIESLGLTQKELATRMVRPLKTINQIIKGTGQIMPETALQLEKVTGVPASFWNSAESNYRERLGKLPKSPAEAFNRMDDSVFHEQN